MAEDRLEEALEAMKSESAPAAEIEAARARVWERLAASGEARCAGFRAELAAYAEGRLEKPKRVLLEDHLARCVGCRRAFAELRGGHKVVAMPVHVHPAWLRYRGWAVAAGAALVLLYAGRDRLDRWMAPSGPRARVESAAGGLHRIPEGALAPGAPVADGETIRTGAGARAVLRLADGSRMELNEHTELALTGAWSGETVELRQGDVIIEAAKQRRGRLRVQTRDATASVKGTVFTVSTGWTGSLVSVLEGSVEVDQRNASRLLKRGEMAASNSALESVDIRQTVAWSQDREKYLALLADFAAIEKQLSALTSTALRTAPALLSALPPGVALYAAAPNLSSTIERALELGADRAAQSKTFAEWWASEETLQLRRAAEDLRSLMPMFGDEIVFVVVRNGQQSVPLLLAPVKPGSEAALGQALARLAAERQAPFAWRVAGGRLTIAARAAELDWALQTAGQGSVSPFAAEIGAHYQRGTGWMAAIDSAAMGGPKAPIGPAGAGVKYIFFEQRQTQSGDENEAMLAFGAARTGLASWLAPGGASGASEYFSSDAPLVFAASTREPRQVFDEFFAQVAKLKPGAANHLVEIETKLGIGISDDLASALGTDFAAGIERAAVPIPAWLAAIEVLKPATLDATLRKVVDAYNAELKPEDQARKLTFTQEAAAGTTWNTIHGAIAGLSVTWTYHAGYLVAGADRALVERAIATRDSGFPLVRSAEFRRRMPAATGLHPSGFVWMNVKAELAELVKALPYPALRTLAESREPVMVTLSGETERIRAASRSSLTSLVLDVMLAAQAGGGSAKGEANATARARHGIGSRRN